MSDLPPPPGPVGGAGGQYPPAAPGGPSFGPPPGQQYAPPSGPPPGQPFGAPSSWVPQEGLHAPKAGFWIRFLAVFLDGIIVGLFAIPGYVVLLTGEKENYQCSSDLSETSTGAFICERPTGATMALGLSLIGVGILAGIAYYVILEGKGQTLGKRAAGVRVADIHTGGPIGTGRAIGRYFARIISGIPCYLGYFWMLWDPQKQTWHDKMVSSVVVKE